MTRILIAHDHKAVDSSLRTVLEQQSEFEIISQVENCPDVAEVAIGTRPDIAILDLMMSVQNGVETTRAIRAGCEQTEVLIYAMHESGHVLQGALIAGARGFVLRTDESSHLIAAVEALGRHMAYISDKLWGNLLDVQVNRRGRHHHLLTPRERDVVQLVTKGNTNRSIGASLGISSGTVESYRASAMRKLGLTSTAGLVLYAARNRLVGDRLKESGLRTGGYPPVTHAD